MILDQQMEQRQRGTASGQQCLSFAYRGLREVPYQTILTERDTLQVLDLSHNQLDDPALLGHLDRLSTLILDNNNYKSHVKFPYMPSLTTLSINKNKIQNLPVFVQEVQLKFPNINHEAKSLLALTKLNVPKHKYWFYPLLPEIRILSMMNNEAAPSYFNGGTLTQYKDYRQYVISQIAGLEVLDHTEVLLKERIQAQKTYRRQQSSSRTRMRTRTRVDSAMRKHRDSLRKSSSDAVQQAE